MIALAKPFSLQSPLFRRYAQPPSETPESPSDSPHLSPESIPNGGSARAANVTGSNYVTVGGPIKTM
jgi:hypothetical protein